MCRITGPQLAGPGGGGGGGSKRIYWAMPTLVTTPTFGIDCSECYAIHDPANERR